MPLMSLFKKKDKSPQAETATATDSTAMKHSRGNGANGRASTSSDPTALADGFGRLSMGSEPRRRQEGGRSNANPGFVGGFAPQPHRGPDAMDWEPIPPNTPSRPPPPDARHSAPAMGFPMPQTYPNSHPGPLPKPPRMAMPVPQGMSLTMAHALAGDNLPADPPPPPPKQHLRPPAPAQVARPHSDSSALPSHNRLQVPPTTPQRPHLNPAPNSAPAKPVSSGPSRPSAPSIQTPPRRARAQSSPPSPISVASSSGKNVLKVQCCAMTKLDKRCTRKVPVTNPLALHNGEEEPQFCHQHIKLAFIDVKFRSYKRPSEEVLYADWVPDYLQESTKTVLREEMQKRASAADEDGYIYAYEIDDDSNPDVVHIKVGRAVKLTKRLAEWDKQCQSKQTHLRGFWPMSKDAADNGMMRGRVQVGDPGPYCHRVERLVHLELADIALNAPYLDPKFPNIKADMGNGNGRTPVRGPCPDCGVVHKEIFTFPRATGRYKGKEWEDIVRPVIEKWGGFVETYV
ncbi:hypothetical protein TRAPUB_12602 [Trametes pubescens]|uniref:Bacteriophage T5 Orf172 DNA-binding domain-containing protein n=1 Tax=Trametes pubescens TaxID=154538 RepID=A0A1M2VTK7_TRAPU|nr:hypothetical protein TRAPUB_12602 [Trametes pubescens]